jgi:phosphoribosylaminoimidazole-succinocarboxamide synthase
MEKLDMLYDGKAKQVYKTEDPNLIILHYKDDTTAFSGVKKARISNKGILNNEISAIIFKKLHTAGVPTHFVEKLNDRDQLCRRATILPFKVVVRNIIAGSTAKRLNIKEGTKPVNVIYELSCKDDELGDKLINDHHAVALGAASYDDLKVIYDLTEKINQVLIRLFDSIDVTLVDFKVEFGKTADGQIILADEISPDNCRLWDKETNDRLDKDRFRRDLGRVSEAYEEILTRLTK